MKIFILLFLFIASPAYGLTIISGTVQNCVITEAVTISGGAMYNNDVYGDTVAATDNCTIQNCILENTGGADLTIASGKEVTGSYNNFDDSAATLAALDGTYTGSNDNYESDPLFIDAANGDFRLQEDSSCIDQGIDLSAFFIIDINNIPRPQYLGWDMGAYEFIKKSSFKCNIK